MTIQVDALNPVEMRLHDGDVLEADDAHLALSDESVSAIEEVFGA